MSDKLPSIFDVSQEIDREIAAREAQPWGQPESGLVESKPRSVESAQATSILAPVVDFVEEMADDGTNGLDDKQKLMDRFKGKLRKYSRKIKTKYQEGIEDIKTNWQEDKEEFNEELIVVGKAITQAARAIRRFNKANRHEMGKLLGKSPEQRNRKLILLSLIGIAVAVGFCRLAPDIFSKFKKNDGSGGDMTPEGQGEPQYDEYLARALYSWEKYRSEGPIEGSMLDPMAIDDFETRLVTGYFPGWFCVPERVEICEKMIGEKLDIPADKTARDLFFINMQANWDTEFWPKIKANPNLSKEVKDFYDPANRDDLRQWYRDNYPISATPQSREMLRATVADKMFERFVETGKLTPHRADILTFSHALGSFVAAAYLANGTPLEMQMKDEMGFIPAVEGWQAKGGMLPGDVRQAYEQIAIISRRPDSNLLDLAPHVAVINEYNQQLEIARKLKAGSLGRI